MLNSEKVKIMNKLAMYEQSEGKKYLPISKYYRSDFVGIALIKNFFLVSIGYIIVLAALGAYFGDFLMENIHRMDVVLLGRYIAVGYAAVLLLSSVLTYIQYNVKYHRAKKSVKKYYQELTKLEKIYGREEKKHSSHRKAGGVD